MGACPEMKSLQRERERPGLRHHHIGHSLVEQKMLCDGKESFLSGSHTSSKLQKLLLSASLSVCAIFQRSRNHSLGFQSQLAKLKP